MQPHHTSRTVIAAWMRRQLVTMTTAAGSGHLTSSLSSVELIVALVFGGVFRARVHQPQWPSNDRLLFSKGHAAPLLYATYAAAGAISSAELRTLRRYGSRLEGHPMPTFPWTDVPTGSLGQGLAVGVGMANAARLQRLRYRTFVLVGDSELAEGSVWEAAALAGAQKLSNLIALVDVNRLGQSRPTAVGWRTDVYARRFAAFGWQTFTVDGHDLAALVSVYRRAVRSPRPSVILAKTVKGKGVSFLENRDGWHGRTLDRFSARLAMSELGPAPVSIQARVAVPPTVRPTLTRTRPGIKPAYALGGHLAPRRAIGDALVWLGSRRPQLVVLDGEVSNSTHTDIFEHTHPTRFIECFIAEQTMVGVAAGLAARGLSPVAATFGAFWSRAADQLRMNAYARSAQVYIGTHAGVAIGADGASQMALADVALFRSLPGSVVLCPADATAAVGLTELALRQPGITYVRALRNEVSVLYPRGTAFTAGGSVVFHRAPRNRATIVASGITVHEALAAAARLARQRVSVRVLDCYSVQPIDVSALRRAARETGRLIVVEDHGPVGGLGDAVRAALGPLAGAVTALSVTKIPRSGRPEQLLRHQGIDAGSIVRAVRRVIHRRRP